MSLSSAMCMGLLAVWFLLSVLAQFRRVGWRNSWVDWVKNRDVLALIPSWTFFAPNPGTRDHELLYRDRLVDGKYSAWKQIERPVGSLARALWNPAKRRQKAVVDMCSLLLGMIGRCRTELAAKHVVISVPYLGLLTYVSMREAGPLSAHRQFLIAHTFGHHSDQPPEILYVSHLHALEFGEALAGEGATPRGSHV